MSKKLDRRERRERKILSRHRIGLTAALLGAVGAASVSMTMPALAQIACASRTDVIESLTKQYEEKSIGTGLASNGNMVELFAGKDRASWTIVITLPNGMSCPILDGESWEHLNLEISGRLS